VVVAVELGLKGRNQQHVSHSLSNISVTALRVRSREELTSCATAAVACIAGSETRAALSTRAPLTRLQSCVFLVGSSAGKLRSTCPDIVHEVPCLQIPHVQSGDFWEPWPIVGAGKGDDGRDGSNRCRETHVWKSINIKEYESLRVNRKKGEASD
jgi:hypothetical protein